MRIESDPLMQAMRDPNTAVGLSPEGWNALLRRARQGKLVARLGSSLEEAGLWDKIPQKAQDHITAARMEAAQHERIVRWEVNRVTRALSGVETDVVLLKGAAYVLAGLPPARGRIVADVDVLVSRAGLARVESALIEHGWETQKVDAYDQRFYRAWMHELPPLRHRLRRAVLDVHHNILPLTGRLHPDAKLLLAAAVPVNGHRLKVLAPADMLLHSAAHLFQDGEVGGAVRDLLDLDDLMRHFSGHPGFWESLVDRAAALDLGRPLYYALHFTRTLVGTPIPDPVIAQSNRFRPILPVRRLMEALVRRAVLPALPGKAGWGEVTARMILYIRSHWLRMPPVLLVQHLSRKALKNWGSSKDDKQPA